ncbi:hypothetical protein LEMLEM_LOCUS24678 [Lemmus lemmus]
MFAAFLRKQGLDLEETESRWRGIDRERDCSVSRSSDWF